MDYPSILAEVTQRTGHSDVAVRGAEFVRRCEFDINRTLRVGDMETSVVRTTNANGEASLPDDFLQMRSVIYAGCELPQINLTSIQDDTLRGYAILGKRLVASVNSASLTLTYYAKITSLIDADTNWLSELDPEVYIYGVMAKVYRFKNDAENAVMAENMFVSKLDSIRLSDAQARFLSPVYRIDGAVV